MVLWVTVAPMEPVSVRRRVASPTTLTTSVVLAENQGDVGGGGFTGIEQYAASGELLETR
jgi:hypothetical protein